MGFLTILFIALALALDAFAVAVASGVTIQRRKLQHAFRIALLFGGFQALMPVAGWLSGRTLREFVAGVDHWVAFGLLCFIGGKMIYEATRIEKIEETNGSVRLPVLLLLSIATSIDALAVGLSFSFLSVAIIFPVVVIGIVTFILSFLGVFVGNKVGHFFEKRIEALGGLILIGIGIKILLAHLFS